MEVFYGLSMALADSVPGVSGGTIAFLMGFYDDLILSLRTVLSRDPAQRRRSHLFLLKLMLGWASGMVAAMKLLAGLMDAHIYFITSMFLGFILASVPAIAWKERRTLSGKPRAALFLLPGFALVFAVTFFSTQTAFELNLAYLTPLNALVLFIAAAAAASAMILPGISGSSLLMAFGLYAPLVQQVGNLTSGNFSAIPIVLVFGFGALTGLLLFIRLVKAALARFRAEMMYAVLVMMAASLYGVIQGPTTLDVPQPALGLSSFNLLPFLLGCALIAAISLMEHFRHTHGGVRNDDQSWKTA